MGETYTRDYANSTLPRPFLAPGSHPTLTTDLPSHTTTLSPATTRNRYLAACTHHLQLLPNATSASVSPCAPHFFLRPSSSTSHTSPLGDIRAFCSGAPMMPASKYLVLRSAATGGISSMLHYHRAVRLPPSAVHDPCLSRFCKMSLCLSPPSSRIPTTARAAATDPTQEVPLSVIASTQIGL